MCSGTHHVGATLTVDLGAVRANYRLLRGRLGATACAAVVKADAYGLGAAAVAPAPRNPHLPQPPLGPRLRGC